jgi:hypothetical protein
MLSRNGVDWNADKRKSAAVFYCLVEAGIRIEISTLREKIENKVIWPLYLPSAVLAKTVCGLVSRQMRMVIDDLCRVHGSITVGVAQPFFPYESQGGSSQSKEIFDASETRECCRMMGPRQKLCGACDTETEAYGMKADIWGGL